MSSEKEVVHRHSLGVVPTEDSFVLLPLQFFLSITNSVLFCTFTGFNQFLQFTNDQLDRTKRDPPVIPWGKTEEQFRPRPKDKQNTGI